jgi:hypothetical protein
MRTMEAPATGGHLAWSAALGAAIALFLPILPFLIGAIEIASFSPELATEWVTTTGIDRAIIEFYEEFVLMFW